MTVGGFSEAWSSKAIPQDCRPASRLQSGAPRTFVWTTCPKHGEPIHSSEHTRTSEKLWFNLRKSHAGRPCTGDTSSSHKSTMRHGGRNARLAKTVLDTVCLHGDKKNDFPERL